MTGNGSPTYLFSSQRAVLTPQVGADELAEEVVADETVPRGARLPWRVGPGRQRLEFTRREVDQLPDEVVVGGTRDSPHSLSGSTGGYTTQPGGVNSGPD